MARTTLVLALACTLGSSLPLGAQKITSNFAGVKNQHGNMFNVKAATTLSIDRFDVHFDDTNNPAPCSDSCSVNEVEVYWKWGGIQGSEKTPSAWTLLGSVQHTISTGQGTPQPLNMPIDLQMTPASDISFYVTSTGPVNSLTGLPNEKMRDTPGYVNKIYTGIIHLRTGPSNQYPFKSFNNDRAWNGNIYYTLCGGNVQNYCTAGTSSSGCQALLTTIGAASASATSGFTVTAQNVEGAKNGLFYYGSSGKIAQPWGASTSFKCVAFPTYRGSLLDGGGTANTCTGTFSYDLNAHWNQKPAQNPGAGAMVQAQLWYRDPNGPNPNTAFSDAIEFSLCP